MFGSFVIRKEVFTRAIQPLSLGLHKRCTVIDIIQVTVGYFTWWAYSTLETGTALRKHEMNEILHQGKDCRKTMTQRMF